MYTIFDEQKGQLSPTNPLAVYLGPEQNSDATSNTSIYVVIVIACAREKKICSPDHLHDLRPSAIVAAGASAAVINLEATPTTIT